jgi:hypothetical protein
MLTIRSRSNRIMQDLDELIRDTIRLMLMGRLGIISHSKLKRLEYFVMYSPGKGPKKKMVTAIFVRKRGMKVFDKIAADEVEITGASIFEFISFLKSIRSRRVKPGLEILENL